MAGLNFLRSTSTGSNGDRGGNGQSITCYRQVHQQAYCAEGRGGSPNDPPFVATRAGAGPRHIAFHSQMPLAYVINELDSSVTTYRFDAQRGSLQPIQILPSIPASYTGNNTGAEIAVAPSGRVVYASNRGHDSIAIFAVDRRDGTLTLVGWAPTQAKSPRFFCLDP